MAAKMGSHIDSIQSPVVIFTTLQMFNFAHFWLIILIYHNFKPLLVYKIPCELAIASRT